jgi:hypothetical protein
VSPDTTSQQEIRNDPPDSRAGPDGASGVHRRTQHLQSAVLAKLRPVLRFGVMVLGVTDVQPAPEFWSAALGYKLREDGFGG